jgi:hypothetical protein
MHEASQVFFEGARGALSSGDEAPRVHAQHGARSPQ